MEGAIISLAFAISLSVIGATGFICSVVFKLINAITELSNAIKEKTQSKDCVSNKQFKDQTKEETRK